MIGFCLAAGSGSRLAPLTRAVPKPLLAPAGRPLLDLACAALEKAGAERVVVNLHHGADEIAAYLAGRPGVETIREPLLLGTGGGLAAARRAGLLGDGDETLLVTCADHVLDPADLALLAAAVPRTGAPVVIGVGAGHMPPRFRLDGGRASPDPDGPWTAAGAYALRGWLLDEVAPGYSELLHAVLEPCWRRGALFGLPLRGAWADAGTLGRFLAVSAGLLSGRWPYPLPPGQKLPGRVFLGAGAVVEPGALLAGPVVLDAGSRVGAGAVVTRAVVGPGATVGAGATVSGSVLGPGARAEPFTITTAALLPPG